MTGVMSYLFLGVFAFFVVGVGSAYPADDAPYQELPHIQIETVDELPVVKVAILAFRNKVDTAKRWQPLFDFFNRTLPHYHFEPYYYHNDEFDFLLQDKSIAFLFTNPTDYVQLTYRYGLSSPLATLVNNDGGLAVSQFAGVVVVRADQHDINTLADLKGKRVAAPNKSSLGAYQMQMHELLQLGIESDDFTLLEVGQPQENALVALLEKRVDAAFVRTGLLESVVGNGEIRSDAIKVVDAQWRAEFPFLTSTRLYPEWPFVALPKTNPTVVREVTAALLNMPHNGDVARALSIEGFTIPGDYREIDALLRQLHLPPFDHDHAFSLSDVWQRWSSQLLTFAGLILSLLLSLLVYLVLVNRRLTVAQTHKMKDEAHIHQLAFYDALTGLPNRSVLTETLAQSMIAAKRDEDVHALVLLNVDRFKLVNDARGKNMGDALLKATAMRLKHLIRDEDLLVRIAADEFALLSQRVNHLSGNHVQVIQSLLEQIIQAFHAPLQVDGEDMVISMSFGVSFYPDRDADNTQAVLRHADTALHLAKAAGGNQFVFFEADMGENVRHRFRIERELRDAVVQHQLRLYLQPQVDAKGALMGAEVLVRWQHPERGLVSPMVFIPIAESSDLIVELGKWVMVESCKLLAQDIMRQSGVRLSVNLSPRHFRQSGFVSWMKQVLRDTGANPNRLTLEITEGLMIDNIHDVIAKMSELHDLGIHFSIDDFGTGYSSLAYIKRLPIQELKIDKTFVQEAPVDADDAALVETILAIAKHLKLSVVAEGVETPEQAAFLNARADVIHQGYLFGKPEPAAYWLAQWQESLK
jgi:diguanylate cyclase (GGDEF)-like protein